MTPQIQQILRTVKTVHLGLVLGVLLFILISAFLVSETGGFVNDDDEFGTMLLIAANVMAFPSIAFGLVIFKNRLKNIDDQSLLQKLETYRAAAIVRSATLEGPAFFFIVGYMLTGYFVFVVEAVAALLLLLFFFPGNGRIAREIRIDPRQLQK